MDLVPFSAYEEWVGLNLDKGPKWSRAWTVSIAAILVGAIALLFFPEPDAPDGEGTILWTKRPTLARKGGIQPVALVKLSDGKQVLAVLPESAKACVAGSRVRLAKDRMRSMIVSNSCSSY